MPARDAAFNAGVRSTYSINVDPLPPTAALQVSGKIADVPLANCGCRQRDVVEIMVDAEFLRHKCHTRKRMPCSWHSCAGWIIGATAFMERAWVETGPTSVDAKIPWWFCAQRRGIGPELRQRLIRRAGLFERRRRAETFLVNGGTRNPARSPATGDAEPRRRAAGCPVFLRIRKIIPLEECPDDGFGFEREAESPQDGQFLLRPIS